MNQNPQRRYALHHSGKSDPSIFNPGRQKHLKASETCSQCHSIRRNIHKEQWNMEGVHYWPGEEVESKAPLIHYGAADLDAPGNERRNLSWKAVSGTTVRCGCLDRTSPRWRLPVALSRNHAVEERREACQPL